MNCTLIWQRMTADRKRFGLLCALIAVGLLLWARIIVIERPQRTAVADSVVSIIEEAEASSDNNFVEIILDGEVTANPFEVDGDTFPQIAFEPDNNEVASEDTFDSTEEDLVATLVLTAVMGEMVMINGNVYHMGDVVAGAEMPEPLLLHEVVGRSVILSAGDRRYELTIASHRP